MNATIRTLAAYLLRAGQAVTLLAIGTLLAGAVAGDVSVIGFGVLLLLAIFLLLCVFGAELVVRRVRPAGGDDG